MTLYFSFPDFLYPTPTPPPSTVPRRYHKVAGLSTFLNKIQLLSFPFLSFFGMLAKACGCFFWHFLFPCSFSEVHVPTMWLTAHVVDFHVSLTQAM